MAISYRRDDWRTQPVLAELIREIRCVGTSQNLHTFPINTFSSPARLSSYLSLFISLRLFLSLLLCGKFTLAGQIPGLSHTLLLWEYLLWELNEAELSEQKGWMIFRLDGCFFLREREIHFGLVGRDGNVKDESETSLLIREICWCTSE